jgi:predicted anti-sigma-YlaC factor YlaD
VCPQKYLTCHDVSTLVSTGGLPDAPLARQLGVRMHLAMCRHCRAFRRQIEAIARAARAAGLAFERELPQDFESKIVQRLRPFDEGGLT